MPALQEPYRSKVLFHVGLSGSAMTAYYAEDRATAENAMDNIENNTVINYIEQLVDRIDDTYERMNPDSAQRFSYKENVSGDINRAVVRDDPRSIIRDWSRIYYEYVDELCRRLGIANYIDPSNRWRYVQDAGTYINSLPGPADTAISSRRIEYVEHTSGLFGSFVA